MPRKHGKVKQTRLTFLPVESSSPAPERSPGSSPFRPAKLRYELPSKRLVRRGQLQLEDYSIGRSRDRAASSSTSTSSDERPGSSALMQTSGKSLQTSPDKKIKICLLLSCGYESN